MTFTRKQSRNLLFNKVPRLGFQRTADSAPADGIVDAVQFTDSEAGNGDYEGMIQYIPTAAASQQKRMGGTITTSKWFHVGQARTETTILISLFGGRNTRLC